MTDFPLPLMRAERLPADGIGFADSEAESIMGFKSVPDAERSHGSEFQPHGYLHVAGLATGISRREIKQLVIQEALRAHRDSLVSDIIAIDDDGSGGLLVSTTTEHLAHRLGQALFNAFGGEVHHGFGRKNKLALVWWRP